MGHPGRQSQWKRSTVSVGACFRRRNESDVFTEIAQPGLEVGEDFVHAGRFVFHEGHGGLTLLELGIGLQAVAQGGRNEGIPLAEV